MSQYVLYSDGGAQLHVDGAAACIVDAEDGKQVRMVAYLGKATNNEGEILAGLLGYAFLRVAHRAAEEASLAVHWVSDSEYVLKSATGYIRTWQKNGWKTASKSPVKNQGLWRSYLALTLGMKVTPEHVRGHTGHPQNEACDTACTWLRGNWSPTLPLVCDVGSDEFMDGWYVLDAQAVLEAIRENPGSDAGAEALQELLINAGITNFSNAAKASVVDTTDFSEVVSHLEQARHAAKGLSSSSSKAGTVVAQLEKMLNQFKK